MSDFNNQNVFIKHREHIQYLDDNFDIENLEGYQRTGNHTFDHFYKNHFKIGMGVRSKTATLTFCFLGHDFHNHPDFDQMKAYSRLTDCAMLQIFSADILQKIGRTYAIKLSKFDKFLEQLYAYLDGHYEDKFGACEIELPTKNVPSQVEVEKYANSINEIIKLSPYAEYLKVTTK